MNAFINKDQIKERICTKLDHHFGVQLEYATKEQFYRAAVMIVQEILIEKRHDFVSESRKREAKTVYYMCMEFLIGRSLRNNLFNLGMVDQFEEAVNELGYSLSYLYDLEPDAGLEMVGSEDLPPAS